MVVRSTSYFGKKNTWSAKYAPPNQRQNPRSRGHQRSSPYERSRHANGGVSAGTVEKHNNHSYCPCGELQSLSNGRANSSVQRIKNHAAFDCSTAQEQAGSQPYHRSNKLHRLELIRLPASVHRKSPNLLEWPEPLDQQLRARVASPQMSRHPGDPLHQAVGCALAVAWRELRDLAWHHQRHQHERGRRAHQVVGRLQPTQVGR
mmetsp:Transcript_25841/g.49079  ORF Transcript_25841/g.49079 Transcript_25841/m.49079 type:complete len:204 (-) Transcript_25841:838-1449(-)